MNARILTPSPVPSEPAHRGLLRPEPTRCTGERRDARRMSLARSSGAGQAIRFAMVGVASTVLYTALFAAFDTRMNHQVANIVALLVCTVLNTWVNQRFTFDAAGHERGRDAHLQSLTILAVTLAVTSGALALEHHQWPHASTLWDTVTVTVGNAIATVIRFVVFRRIFASRD